MILETKYAIKILHTFTSILKCIMIIEFKISQCFFFFYVLLTVHLSIILVINQLNAQILVL